MHPTIPAKSSTVRALGVSCVLAWWGGAAALAQDWPDLSATLWKAGFNFPVHVTHAGDGSGRIFVVEMGGAIQVIRSDGSKAEFLNLNGRSGCSQGLLSVAFPPNYAAKRYFYINYTDAANCDLVIARVHVTADPDRADFSTAQEIVRVPKVAQYGDQAIFHSGGELAFGPDGYLYVGIGDGDTGKSPGDSLELAQNVASLRGKILRLDVEGGVEPYAPASNPFVNTPGAAPQIWAVGVRNPWRSSFDRLTHDFYFGDVGQDQFEEINYQRANTPGGLNFGWRLMEGDVCYVPAIGCDPAGALVLPITQYVVLRNGGDNCVIGGRVYRGATYPRMRGIYFYGDYGSGRVSGLRFRDGLWETQTRIEPFTTFAADTLLSFGEDESGNIYVAKKSGEILKLSDSIAVSANTAPVATGGIASTHPGEPVNIALMASDVDNDPLTYVIVTPPAHGTLSAASANVTYTPAAGFSGADGFTFKVHDGAVESNVASVAITVGNGNTDPVAVNDNAQTRKNIAVTVLVLANDTDADGDALTVTGVSTPARGTASIVNNGAAVRYTPAKNASGKITFNYTISDGRGGAATAVIAVNVTAK